MRWEGQGRAWGCTANPFHLPDQNPRPLRPFLLRMERSLAATARDVVLSGLRKLCKTPLVFSLNGQKPRPSWPGEESLRKGLPSPHPYKLGDLCSSRRAVGPAHGDFFVWNNGRDTVCPSNPQRPRGPSEAISETCPVSVYEQDSLLS